MVRLLQGCLVLSICWCGAFAVAESPLRAGAAAVDISPLDFPVIINGGMAQRTADKVVDRLHARSLVLDDGVTRIALVVIDSCMMPRDLLDDAKQLASRATGIPTSRILMSATHTHSAPASMGCLGTDRDDAYAAFVAPQLAKAVQQANERLQPARIGWAFGRDEKNVACRRWEMKDGVAPTNPFGGTSHDRAQMHPGHNNPNAIRATGPPDPEIPVVSLQTAEGRPLAMLAAYSLHYVGTVQPVSADYFSAFCRRMTELVGADRRDGAQASDFFPALANATSGDMWLMDYTEKERRKYDHETVAGEVAAAAMEAYRTIDYQDDIAIRMLETELELNVRMPSQAEVAEAREFVKTFAGRLPKSVPEVYARETLLLNDMPPTRHLKLQAIRLGDLAIVAIPNEVFSDTGLAIKRDSPFRQTFTIELANGAEGYIPPPDQHPLGGYTTWRARTSCLEPDAEPKIRARLQEMLRELAAE